MPPIISQWKGVVVDRTVLCVFSMSIPLSQHENCSTSCTWLIFVFRCITTATGPTMNQHTVDDGQAMLIFYNLPHQNVIFWLFKQHLPFVWVVFCIQMSPWNNFIIMFPSIQYLLVSVSISEFVEHGNMERIANNNLLNCNIHLYDVVLTLSSIQTAWMRLLTK